MHTDQNNITDHDRQRCKHFLKRLGLAILPFALLLFGLVIISFGFFHYVEQESILAMFLTSRDSLQFSSLHGDGWEKAINGPSEMTTQTAQEKENGRLLVPFFYIGECFGTISIPSVKIKVNAFQGDSEAEFRKGVGHYPGSFYPGQNGNILIAGHRTSFFRNFEYLKIGDLVYFETTYGKFTYKIRELKIIDGQDQSVADDTAQEQLTMYTCYPFVYFGNAPGRFVVICDLIERQVGS